MYRILRIKESVSAAHSGHFENESWCKRAVEFDAFGVLYPVPVQAKNSTRVCPVFHDFIGNRLLLRSCFLELRLRFFNSLFDQLAFFKGLEIPQPQRYVSIVKRYYLYIVLMYYTCTHVG